MTARAAAGTAQRITPFNDRNALAEAVAGLVAGAVTGGIQRTGRATLVLSGGSTPEWYLPRVAGLDLPWERVNIMLTDERWVGEESPDSNTAMLRRTLLARPGPARAHFIPFKAHAVDVDDGAVVARAHLPPAAQRHDLVLLGMGNDGHIASLFPGNPRLPELLSMQNTERLVAVPAPASVSPHVARLTLTLAEIMNALRVVLVLQGDRKREVLESAWRNADRLHTPVVALGDVEALWCP